MPKSLSGGGTLYNKDMAKVVPCRLCGADETEGVFVVDGLALVKCSRCGLVYVNPQPTPSEREFCNLRIYRSREYKEQYFRDRRALERRFRKKLKQIERYNDRGRLLDIGCSYGFFLRVAKVRGWDVYGVEANPDAARYASEIWGLKVVQGRFEETKWPVGFFDVVTMWDVLEHMPDPTETLRTVRNILKRGGILAIQCPNIDSLVARRKQERWNWLTPGDHLYYFSPHTLSLLLEKAGYSVLSLYTWEPTRYFVDSLFSFEKHKGIVFVIYRKSILRGLRSIFSFLFAPVQCLEKIVDRGALIVAFARREYDTSGCNSEA